MEKTERCPCGIPLSAGGACPRCSLLPPAWYDVPTIPHQSRPTVPITVPSVPGYEIQGELGRGGMGVVYQARQLKLNRIVALKMILAGSHASPQDRERFRREAEAVASLQNPHIVQIFEIGEHLGQPFLALEYVNGGTLADQLLGQPWPSARAAELIEIVALAIQDAHNHDIVHRDLKPANILLCKTTLESNNAHSSDALSPLARKSLFPKVTDFGLAKKLDENSTSDGHRTGTGTVLGTPNYIAPEQAAGGHSKYSKNSVGPAADIYSLGAILYELLTGRPPFHGSSAVETVLQVLNDDPLPPSRLRPTVPKDLENICMTCLHKVPQKRYSSAAALANDLRCFLDGRPVAARPVSTAVRFARWAARHPALTVLGATSSIAVVVLVTGLSLAYMHVRKAVREKEYEAQVARARRIEADLHREIAEQERQRANRMRDKFEELAKESDQARKTAETQARALAEQAESSERNIFALQLSQVAALCERKPQRAISLLTDPNRCPLRLREFTWHHLRRLADRQERIYSEHREGLSALATSPGSPLVATVDRNNLGDVRVWDPRTGVTWAILTGAKARSLDIAISHDGGLVAVVDEQAKILIWELPQSMLETARIADDLNPAGPGTLTQIRLQPFVIHATPSGSLHAIAFRRDGREIATAGEHGTIQIWTVSRRQLQSGHAGLGGVIATARYHSSPGIQPVRTLRAAAATMLSLCYAPDGDLLAAGAEDGTIQLWNSSDASSTVLAPQPRQPSRPADPAFRGSEPIFALQFSPDGRTLASTWNGPDPAVLLWDLNQRTPRRRLTGLSGTISALAFSPDGQSIAAGGLDANIRIWETATGRERSILTGHEQAIRGLAFSHDRRTLISASSDRTARVWLAKASAADTTRLTQPVTSAAVSASGQILATSDPQHRITVWSIGSIESLGSEPGASDGRLASWEIFSTPSPVGAVHSLTLSKDDRSLLITGKQGTALLEVRPRALSRGGIITLTYSQRRIGPPKPVHLAAISPDGQMIAIAVDSEVQVWDLKSGTIMSRLSLSSSRIRKLELIPPSAGPGTASWIVAIAEGRSVRLLDLTNRVIASADHETGAITAIAADSGGKFLATGDTEGGLRIWARSADGGLIERASVNSHSEDITDLDFSQDGKTLGSASHDRTIILWDPVTGEERAALNGHTDPIVSLGFGGKEFESLMSVGRNGTITRWRADPRGRLPSLPRFFPDLGTGSGKLTPGMPRPAAKAT